MKKQFICASKEYCSYNNFVNAPYLRKSFLIDKVPEKAEISICGLGFYVLYINGTDITKGALAPYISNPDHLCYYDTYDISKYLKSGKNVFGIILGNGFNNPFGGAVWDFEKAGWISAPRVAFEFKVDGEVVFTADETVKVHNSPIIFDELRMGEHYDASLEIKNWNMPVFDDADWGNAVFSAVPKGELTECMAEPICVTKEIKPISVVKQGDDYLYDFGENNAGVCALKINAEKGQKIELLHGEILTEGRFDNCTVMFNRDDIPLYQELCQKDIYIASGLGVEEYTPRFTYHGFRYVLVKGITEEQATKDLLTYKVMSSNLDGLGTFECSDETVNTLLQMVRRSDLSNFYYFPTDCPHREKNGWTGDVSFSADHMVLLYDVEKSFEEWLKNIRAAQVASGQIPVIIPTNDWGYGWGSGPAWDTVLFNLPYELWKKRGNTKVIKDNAKAFMNYFDYILSKRDENGLVSIGLGDWCPAGKPEHKYNTPVEVSNAIMMMDMARKATEMLSAVGDLNYLKTKEIFNDFRSTVRNVLLDKNTLEIKGNAQTGQALALYYGVFEKDEEEKAFENLLKYIKQNNNNFDCGFLGLHVIFHVLSKFGQTELAYNMITKDEFPSYKYLIDQGETTLVEMFRNDGLRRFSHNHHFFGDIARWFTVCVAGLNVVNCNTVEIKPNFVEKLTYASASYTLKAGKVGVLWKKADGKIILDVSCNKEINCSICLPNGYAEGKNVIINRTF